ncbi:MAG: response regulator [Lachnospiraceae bacterium]|nr:response regulator [Lachnospiraceae bacterium]
MEKKVVVAASGGGFMVNAILNGLKGEGYESILTEAKINKITQIPSDYKLAVLYLDSDIAKATDLLVFLRDHIIEKEVKLFLVGSQEEIDETVKVLGSECVTDVLVRPLNVKDLAAKLDKAVEKGLISEAKKKILIVDDDPTMLRMIKSLLSEKYHVFMANSGMNAITFLATNDVDLILLDYEMPVISGAKVLEMIRSEVKTEHIPVMFLTAKNDKESVMNVIALKPEKYLLKTMAPGEWIKNIDEFFESH